MHAFNYISNYALQDSLSVAKSCFIQPKLTINNPNDQYEQEADAVADKIMRTEQPFIQPKIIPVTQLQCKCAHCEEEEKKMQRKEINDNATNADNTLESYVSNLSSGGHPLSDEVCNFYEPRFGYDFSSIRIHDNSQAHQSSASINALAYTQGNHIVFGKGQYQPDTKQGKQLLAHELVHTIQQKGSEQSIQRLVRKDRVNNCEDKSSKPSSDLLAAEQIAFDFLQKGIKKIERALEQYQEAVHKHFVPDLKQLKEFNEAFEVAKHFQTAFGFSPEKPETWEKLKIARVRFMKTISYLDSVVFDYTCCENDNSCPKIGLRECTSGLAAIVRAKDNPNLIILCPEFWGTPVFRGLTIAHEIMHLWSGGFIDDAFKETFGIKTETPKFLVASRYEKFLKLLNS
jgi:hypothetical protein